MTTFLSCKNNDERLEDELIEKLTRAFLNVESVEIQKYFKLVFFSFL